MSTELKSYRTAFYCCGCGFKTIHPGNACRHKKVACGFDMKSESREFVLKDEHLASVVDNSRSVNNSTVHGDVDNSITINLVVPDKTIVAAIHDAVKNPKCVEELRCANTSDIPAILFKYTRGTGAEQQYIKYDGRTDSVVHKDSVTGEHVSKDLKKYRNEYLRDSSDVFDDGYHIQFMPTAVIPQMKEMTDPVFPNGKKKDDPISGSAVVKTCASGDHAMYKSPIKTKSFYTNVVKSVDREIKSTK